MKAERDRKIAGLEGQIDLFVETIAEQDRRPAKYENLNAPSSANSMYNAERDAFRKRLSEEERDKGQGASGSGSPRGVRRAGAGAPEGHEGASHGNRLLRGVRLRLRRCQSCRLGHLAYAAPVTRIANDFPDGGDRRIKTVAHVLERGLCKRCGTISTTLVPLMPSTSLGLRALGFMLEYMPGGLPTRPCHTISVL